MSIGDRFLRRRVVHEYLLMVPQVAGCSSATTAPASRAVPEDIIDYLCSPAASKLKCTT